jgi:hypothetical protein
LGVSFVRSGIGSSGVAGEEWDAGLNGGQVGRTHGKKMKGRWKEDTGWGRVFLTIA